MAAAAFTVALCVLLSAVTGLQSNDRECAFTDLQGAEPQGGPNHGVRGEVRDNGTVRCSRGSRCYSVWEKHGDGRTQLVKQGCWIHVGNEQECLGDRCLVTATPSQIQNGSYHFCCCSRDLCNADFSEAPPTPDTPPLRLMKGGGTQTDQQPLKREETALVALVTVAITAVLIIALFLGYRMMRGKHKASLSPLVVMETANTDVDLDDLKLLQLIGRGRHGAVFRGDLSGRCVAVKLFSATNRQIFDNERLIYSLPLLRHDNIARFLTADHRSAELLIVMENYAHGSLCQYLSLHTVDWWTCVRMCVCVTRGLAFLHTELWRAGQSKPAVAHRDLTSRNVLVRSDLTCVLADFGLSMKLSGTTSGHHGDDDIVAISEVGTVRYMAPEVLGGALNLRDCESALKQVDVYALGLIYWEMFRRCRDLFTGDSVPEFQLAFQVEVGNHPSFEQMQILVLREKQRPKFPQVWKEESSLHSLIEIIEDCWDQDAEARLSAHCAEERLRNLSHGRCSPQVGSSYIKDVQVGVVQNLQFDASAVVMTTSEESEEKTHSITYEQQKAQVSSSRAGPTETPPHPCSAHPLRKQQNLPVRPSSLQLVPKAEDKLGRVKNHRQVETGVAKMNALTVVAATAPHVVTTVNYNTRNNSAGAPKLVTNGMTGRGRTNPAGPQPDEETPTNDGRVDFNFSPDEREPLLRSQELRPLSPHRPRAGTIVSGQRSNSNNNNNRAAPASEVMVQKVKACKMKGSKVTGGVTPELQISATPSPSTAVEDRGGVSPTDPCPHKVLDGSQTPEGLGSTSTKAPEGPRPDASGARDLQDVLEPSWTQEGPASDPEDSAPPPEGSETSISEEAAVQVKPRRTRRPERPSSLDLTSCCRPADGEGSSGEKIKGRVQTPYTLKKWRASSWVVSTETTFDPDPEVDGSVPNIVQSKSSMAVFMVGGGAEATSDPVVMTCF